MGKKTQALRNDKLRVSDIFFYTGEKCLKKKKNTWFL